MSKFMERFPLVNRVICAIARWQDMRFLWGLMVFVCLALVAVAHFLFQEYGYMRPCEQCVYIRYAFIVMALGGIIALINPRNVACKVVAYIVASYGIIRGIMFSVKLNTIHRAAHSEDAIFGVQGCSTDAKFDFGLPLDKWFPSWFAPTGDCGFDYSTPPEGVVLEGFRKAFVEFYSEGWYLIPSQQFGNMAQCCLLAYIVCAVILLAMLSSWVSLAISRFRA